MLAVKHHKALQGIHLAGLCGALNLAAREGGGLGLDLRGLLTQSDLQSGGSYAISQRQLGERANW